MKMTTTEQKRAARAARKTKGTFKKGRAGNFRRQWQESCNWITPPPTAAGEKSSFGYGVPEVAKA